MNLKKHLKKNRYGERNIIVPDREETRLYMQPRDRARKVVGNLSSKVMYHFFHPPKRGKFYLHYIYIPNLFHEYTHKMTTKGRTLVMANLINHHLCGKLIYMLDHPSRYGEFKDFKHAWITNALWAMRATCIKQAYLAGKLNTSHAYTLDAKMHIPYPKPLDHHAMGLLADTIYDLVYDRAIYLSSIRKT